MIKSKIIQIIIGLCLYTFCQLSFAQSIEVKASVDKNPVMVDESFILSVIANGDIDTNAFDSSFLMKDFVVGRTSVSSQTKMINFKTTQSTTWSTVLIPRKQGLFTIPSFDLNGNKTESFDLVVIPESTTKTTNGRDLFITTEVDLDTAYLQQQIQYTVKLHLGRDLQRGTLSSPTLENADIRQIGKDKEYNEIVENRRYRIIERTFAIIPQKSGTFTINGPLFEGELIDNSQQNFGFFNRSKIVNRVGPEQTIEIQPIPSGYSENWLPSEYVQINEEWQNTKNEFIAGEPVTRTITLTAIGVVEEQLPEIASHYPSSVKTYPDKAETATLEKDNTLIAQRKESIALIPNEVGELLLPEVKVPWFNTVTEKTEYATLPAKTIQVQPAILQPVSDTPAPTNLAPSEKTGPEIETSKATVNVPAQIYTSYWQWLCLGLAILWGVTVLAWWYHSKILSRNSISSSPSQSVPRTSESEQSSWRALEKALDKNDALATQQYLEKWLRNITKDRSASLSLCVSKLNNPELVHLVNELLASRYSQNRKNWSANDLHSVLRKLRKDQKGMKHAQLNTDLTPLYPNT
ncbi:BatD family protein [Paraglaciecola sp.]|uniref:BatD family protein n=1 Tax=Paraglaciecola sp. TaxID=1920173 RepID=UPI003264AC8F